MNILSRTVIGLLFVCLMSCQEYGVQVRIENNSSVDFEEVTINNVPFGPLKSAEISPYVPFEYVYEREFIEVTMESKVYRIIPEGYDSANFYDQGNYRFVVDVTETNQLTLGFRQE